MDSSSLRTVERRLDRLEREVRHWRRAASVVALVCLCLLVSAPFLPEVVVTESEHVVQTGGTTHGVFAAGDTSTRLSLRDGAGPGQGSSQARAELLHSSVRGPSLTLSDAEGQARLRAGLSGGGGRPVLHLNGSGGDALVEMTTDGDRGGRLHFRDGAQSVRLRVGMDANGLPEIALFDSRERPRMRLGMDLRTEDAWLALYDSEGRLTQRLPEVEPLPLPAQIGARPTLTPRVPVEIDQDNESRGDSIDSPGENPRSDIRRFRQPRQ
jgi:hypothetical protein